MSEKLQGSAVTAKDLINILREVAAEQNNIKRTTLQMKIDDSIDKAKQKLDGVSGAIEALVAYQDILAKKKTYYSMSGYFASEEKAIDRLKEAWKQYADERDSGVTKGKDLSEVSSAKNVLIYANALEALTGKTDSISNVNAEIATLVKEMRELSAFKNYNLGVDQFKPLFDVLKNVRVYVDDLSSAGLISAKDIVFKTAKDTSITQQEQSSPDETEEQQKETRQEAEKTNEALKDQVELIEYIIKILSERQTTLPSLNTKEEIEEFGKLKKIIDDIKEAVDKKTDAFKSEAATVAKVVPTETNYLAKLVSALKTINAELDKIAKFNGLDLSNLKMPEENSPKIASGATDVSGNPKEAKKRKERTGTKKDNSLTQDQLDARTKSLSEATDRLEADLEKQGSVVKEIVMFYDSQDNLVKTVLKEEQELDGIIKGTTWTTNYDLKSGDSFSSHIDTYNYDKIRKQQESERLAQEKRLANEEKKARTKMMNKSYAEEKRWLKEIYSLKEKNAQAVENNSPTQERDIAYNNALIVSYEELIADEREYRKEKNLDDGNRNNEYELKLISEYEARRDAYNKSLENTIRLNRELAERENEERDAAEFDKMMADLRANQAAKEKAITDEKAAQEKARLDEEKQYEAERAKQIDPVIEAYEELEKTEDRYQKLLAKRAISDLTPDEEKELRMLTRAREQANNVLAQTIVLTQKQAEAANKYQKKQTDITIGISSYIDSSVKADADADNDKAAEAYKELFDNAKKYYELLGKEDSENILPEELELLNKLKEEWEDAVAAKGKYAKNSIGNSENYDREFQNFKSNSMKSYAYDITATASDFQEQYNKIERNPKNLKWAEKYHQYLREIESKIKELSKYDDMQILTPESVGTVEKLKSEISEMLATVKSQKGSFDFIQATAEEVYRQMAKVEQTLNENTRMARSLKNEFKALNDKYQFIVDTGGSRADLQNLNDEFAKLKYRMEKAGKTGKSLFTLLQTKIRSISTDVVARYFSMQDYIRYGRQILTTIKEYDAAITEMNKVSNESIKTLKRFQIESFDIADALGTTSLQIQNSTADWMRLGESIEDARESAAASNILFNVSEFDSIDSATESLVSMSQAYKDLEKMDIVDIMNNIGNNYAISTDGLATALQNSASSLTTAGNDINEAVALITAGNAIAQDPSSVGAGLRTISLRLVGTKAAKSELESIGEDTEGLITTTSKLRDTIISATKSASGDGKGFDILDDSGNYKSTYEIMLGLADLYDEIVEKDRELGTNNLNLLLETIAGKNRSNIAASILQNADLLESVYNSSLDSKGSAARENEAYLESIQGHIEQIKNLWAQLWIGEHNREFVNFFLDAAKYALELIDKLGAVKILLGSGGLYGAFVALRSVGVFDGLAKDLSNISKVGAAINSLKGSANIDEITRAIHGMNAAQAEAVLSTTALTTEQKKSVLAKTLDIKTTGTLTAAKYEELSADLKAKLAKAGIITANAAESASEHVVTAEKLKAAIQTDMLSDEEAELVAAKSGVVLANEAEAASLSALKSGFNGALAGAKNLLSGLGAFAFAHPIITLVAGSAALLGGSLLAISKIQSKVKEKIEETNESAKSLAETFKSFQSEANSNLKTISSLSDRFDELSRGVNSLGDNISLTEDEYSEYLDICNQVGSIMPDLISYYNDEGDAIINLKNNVESLTEAYKENIKTGAINYISNGDENGNTIESVLDAYNNFQTGNRKGYLGSPGSMQDDLEDFETYYSKGTVLDWLSTASTITFDDFYKEFQRGSVQLVYLNKLLAESGFDLNEMTQENFNQYHDIFYRELTSLQQEVDGLVGNIRYSLMQFVYADEDYFNIDDANISNAINKIIGNIDSAFVDANNLNSQEGMSAFVSGLMDSIFANRDTISESFATVFSDSSIYAVQEALNSISEVLGYDDTVLAMLLGLGDLDTVRAKYSSMLNSAAKNASGTIDYDIINGTAKFDEYTAIYNRIDAFATEHSINTISEIEFFEQCLNEAQGDIDAAFDKYLEKKVEDFNISTHEEEIDKFQDSLSSLADTYTKVLSGNHTGSEMLDMLQKLAAAGADLSKINSIEDIQNVIQDIQTEKLSTLISTLKDAGADQGFLDYLILVSKEALNVKSALEGTTGALSNIQNGYNTVSKAAEEYNENGFLTIDTLNSLLTLEPEYLSCLIDENGQLSVNEDAYKSLAKVQLEKAKAAVVDEAMVKLNELAHYGLKDVVGETKVAEEKLVINLQGATDEFARYAQEVINATGANISLVTANVALDESLTQEQKTGVLAAYSSAIKESKVLADEYINDMNAKLKLIDETGKNIEDAFKSGYTGGSSSDSIEIFDWIEKKIDRISRKIESLGKVVSDTFSTWGKRNKSLISQISETTELLSVQRAAADEYLEKANDVGLAESWAAKVRDGSFDIEELKTDDKNSVKAKENEILIEQIERYTEYYEKYLDLLAQEEDTLQEINSLRSQYLDNISTHYENRLSKFENKASMLEAKLAGAESRGIIATQYYYKKLEKNEGENLAVLYGELEAQEVALSHLQAEKGSEEWWKQYNAVQETKLAIQESQNAIKDYQNQLRQTNWDVFDWEREQEAKLMDQADFMLELIDRVDKFDDKGNILDAGITSIGLHGANYNAYLEQSIKYAKELQDLESQIADTPYDTNLIARRDEILEQQQEMILAAEDEKEAIAELVKEGIELQKEALQELIDEYGEALDAQKDLYDQQKKTAQQTKKIADLEKQLAAYSGVQTEEARAKVQELQLALSEERDTLESDQYDQYISDQKEILSSIYDEYEEVMDDYMENTEKMFSDAMALANNSTKTVSDTLKSTGDKVGYEVSQDLYDIWNKESSTLATSFAGVQQNITNNTGVVSGIAYTVSHDLLTSLGLVGTSVATLAADLNAPDGIKARISDERKKGTDTVVGYLQTIQGYLAEIAGKKPADSKTFSTRKSYDRGEFKDDGTRNIDGVVFEYKDMHDKAYEAGDPETDLKARLRWNNFADGMANRRRWWRDMGYESIYGAYADTEEQNQIMIGWLRARGYASGVHNLLRDELAWTQEHGTEAIIRPSDGAILTPLAKGDSVLNAEATSNLWDMMNNPVQFIKDNMATTLAPANVPVLGGGNNTIENSIDLSITLPHVTNYTEFVTALQKDKKFEAMIQDMTVNQLTGVGHLAKYKHKF